MPDDTKAEIRVRAATLADTVNVAKFCLKTDAWHGRSGSTDETRVYQLVFGLISKGWVGIADLSGNVVGAIGVLAIQPSHTVEWTVYVDWLKVQGHLKDSGVTSSLLRFALRVAKKGNSNLLLNLSTTDIEQIGDATLAGFGFAPAQRMWVRRADAVEQPRAEQPAESAERADSRTVVGVEPDPAGHPADEAGPAVDIEPTPAPSARSESAVAPEAGNRPRYKRADGPTAGQLAAARFAARRAAKPA